MHFRRNVAQVFREEGQPSESLAQLVKQVIPRTIHPPSIDRCRIRRRNLPELIEAAEVIETDEVAVSCCPAQALNPPFISPCFHHIPAVKGIAPALPRLAEEVRWHAGDSLGLEIFIQAKKITMHPNVGAIVIYEDGDVAND